MINIIFEPQIHIAFNSDEHERITFPIISSKPNKLYYFKADLVKMLSAYKYDSYFEKNVIYIMKKLPTIDIIEKQIDLTNYFEIIQEISKIIRFERESNLNSKFYINIGSGSKLTAIASLEAAKIWNIETFYVYSQDIELGIGPKHKGKMIMIPIKGFPIQKPDTDLIKVIKIIEKMIPKNRKFVYKKHLLDELKNKGLLDLLKENKDYEKLKSAEYMTLNQRYLNPLEKDLKYIEISDDKRNKKIFLTDEGERVLKIFKYYI